MKDLTALQVEEVNVNIVLRVPQDQLRQDRKPAKLRAVRLVSDPEPSVIWRDVGTRERSAKGCLLSFIDLVDDPEQIRKFVYEWGPLRKTDKLETAPDGRSWGREPLWEWMYYVKRARAIIKLVEGFRNNSLTDTEWRDLLCEALGYQAGVQAVETGVRYGDGRPVVHGFDFEGADKLVTIPESDLPRRRELDVKRTALAFVVTQWLRSLECFPRLIWDTEGYGRLVLDFEGSRSALDLVEPILVRYRHVNLGALSDEFLSQRRKDVGVYRAVGLQLADRVVHGETIYFCCTCGHAYERSEKNPKVGDDNYCSEPCKKRGQNQKNKINMREKRARAREAVTSGESGSGHS